MPRKKSKKNQYWTKITECAVSAYNNTDDRPILRERIYRRFLSPALFKLSENLINTMKPTYIRLSFTDLQADLVTYLTERLYKFNPENGKAYSYYTRTGINFLIAENQKAYEKLKSKALEVNIDEQRNVFIEDHNTEMAEHLKDFMDSYVEHCYENLRFIFNNPTDIHVADSILHLFENRINIDEYNKKALYIFIRERTGLETTNITKVVKVLKEIYTTKFEEFQKSNFMNLPF